MDEEEKLASRLVNVFEKTGKRYKECKTLAEKYEYTDVVLASSGLSKTQVVDEYAKQVNKTNIYRQKLKDLEFLEAHLTELKDGLTSTPRSKESIRKIDTYVGNIKSLIKVYQTIEQMQVMIVRYYEKGWINF